MSEITEIRYNQDNDRYWIYIDGQYCTSIRARTFKGMNLTEGLEITDYQVKEKENFYWKQSYGQTAWKKEKVRLDRVTEFLKSIDSRIAINVIGFGADTTDLIKAHPKESGKPDLKVVLSQDQQISIMLIEVTGTESKRGNDYWIRPDKLEYCRTHPDERVWIILHYAKPNEQFVFIKPDNSKQYQYTKKTIRGSDEYYVIFDDSSPETNTREEFISHLKTLVDHQTS